ncbi:hypothetical protein VIGAN_07245600 [Vigna angularis var. angularis]|uniref:Uncharacterized protein n=1 Tax=Vigna angularis var. angularis TaxID=157739 RepID=A0A0S3SKT8_PHAAN|nr:hypothetical protein VIGAN_07245600 [Vigna angularis var. angularis]
MRKREGRMLRSGGDRRAHRGSLRDGSFRLCGGRTMDGEGRELPARDERRPERVSKVWTATRRGRLRWRRRPVCISWRRRTPPWVAGVGERRQDRGSSGAVPGSEKQRQPRARRREGSHAGAAGGFGCTCCRRRF